MSTFIAQIAQELISSPLPLHQQMVVLPNQRAEIFLREALKPHLEGPTLLPLFTTVDGFISNAGNLLVVEPLVLLIELHQCYNEARYEAYPDREPESLGSFLSWGQTLLSDFEEIDRYKLNPVHVLGDLYNVQKLAEWDLDPENETALMGRYSDFVALLPSTYERFKDALLARGEAHSGLASRYLSENLERIDSYLNRNGVKRVLVAGLNALNTAELTIIGQLKNHWNTTVMWDLDPHYVDMNEHEAGLFLRAHKNRQKIFGKDVPTTKNRSSDFLTVPKEITPVGASKYSGQAKTVAATLERWATQGVPAQNIAVILADETLLNPVLSILPESYDKVNITMGYPLDQTKVAATVRLWIGAVEYALKNEKSGKNWTYYHRSLSALFSDPLFNKYYYLGEIEEGPREWNQSIIKGNRVFTSSKEWTNELTKGPKGYHHLLQPARGISVLASIKKWLEHVAAHEKGDTMVINTTYKIHTLLEQLERTLGSTEVDTLSVLKLVKQQLRSGTIDFVGEPLEGLQIMGILESRTLDFSHVIMAGVNEGILPAGRSFNSLLPYDIKQTYDLPTYEQKDAIFAYHFYRILQRCSEGVIVYNTNTDAMGGGEPSRYIVQLEQELQQGACTIHPRAFNNGPIHPSSIEDRFYAERSDAVKEAMADWMKRGMSATSLNELAGRPHDFYQKRLVRVREQDEVEESMSALVMGNLIHHGLEELYKPLVGKPLPVFDVDEWTQKALELGIERLVKEGYSESALYQGRNLVTLEVCKKMLDQFLHYDLLRAKAGKTILKGVETELEFEMQHPSLDLPLKFVGKVDRIEMTDGRLTVWDYKTGRMKPYELSLSTWEDLWNGKKPKALQCLLYAWLLWKSGAATSPLPWRIGMYKMQSPQPESLLRGGAFDGQVLGEQDLIEFEHQLMEFLVGQLSSDEPFVEPPPKDYYS